MAMLFPDISCTISESMERNQTYGVYDLVDVDFMQILTIVKDTAEIKVNASLQRRETDVAIIDQFLAAHIDEILSGTIFHNVPFRGYFLSMTGNKSAKPFIAFTLLGRKDSPFAEKDLKWMDVYTSLNADRIILKNTILQERNYLESIITSSSASIIALNQKGEIRSYNPVAASIVDIDAEEHLRFSNTEQEIAFSNIVHDVIKSGEKARLSAGLLPQKNRDLLLNTVVSPLSNSKGIIAGVVIVSTDITKSQLLSLEVEQLKQYGLLGELSLGMAHDVKNPLASIQGCAQLLHQPREAQQQAELSNIIVHEVSRINDVINQMLTYGNVSGKNQTDVVDINQVLCNCVQIVERQMLGKTAHFDLSLSDTLPSIRAKEIQIQQIFLNLMLNALQALKKSGEIRIRTGYLERETQIWVEIEDTGAGISEENLTRIFQPYFTTKKAGTGMGLSIVKQMVGAYGGQIDIRSQQGKGTCCRVSLPLSYAYKEEIF